MRAALGFRHHTQDAKTRSHLRCTPAAAVLLRGANGSLVEVGEADEELFDGPPVLLVRPVEGREGELLPAEPSPVPLRPDPPVPVHPPVSGEGLQ